MYITNNHLKSFYIQKIYTYISNAASLSTRLVVNMESWLDSLPNLFKIRFIQDIAFFVIFIILNIILTLSVINGGLFLVSFFITVILVLCTLLLPVAMIIFCIIFSQIFLLLLLEFYSNTFKDYIYFNFKNYSREVLLIDNKGDVFLFEINSKTPALLKYKEIPLYKCRLPETKDISKVYTFSKDRMV